MASRTIEIEAGDGGKFSGYLAVPESGSGPGLILGQEIFGINGTMRETADYFAEEGYVVLAPDMAPESITGAAGEEAMADAARALRALPEHSGRVAAIGFGRGGALACRGAARAERAAVVAYDFDGAPADAAAASCPLALHLAGPAAADAAAFRRALAGHDDARVFAYDDAAPGFILPGDPAHDRRIADIAHTRTLDLLRPLIGPHYDFVALFAEHAHHEFVTRDVDATMATMVAEPYVNHVATMTGGVGHDMLKRFYKYHFVMQNAEPRSSTPISYTQGGNRVVIEQVVRFRHDFVIDRMYPGIEPTGKTVELPLILVVKFRGPKVAHEHIYRDQASALAQIGLIDTDALPVAGAEQAAKLLDETLPSNALMEESWKTSEGKPI